MCHTYICAYINIYIYLQDIKSITGFSHVVFTVFAHFPNHLQHSITGNHKILLYIITILIIITICTQCMLCQIQFLSC